LAFRAKKGFMKTFKTLPTNEEFFKKYAMLVPTLNILGYLAQVVSALTEIGVIFLLIFSSLANIFPAVAFPVAVVGCVIGTAFLEVGLRKFTPYSVRAILYNRFQGLDRIMSIFVLAACLLLLGASGFLSFKGSKTIIEAVAPPPATITTASADSTASAAKAETMEQYRADSIGIASRHAAQAQALKTSAASAIAAEKIELRNIEAKERATGQTFGTQKREARKRVADIEAKRDAQLAQLGADKATALVSLTADRRSASQRIEADHSARRDSVITYNNGAVEQAAKQVKTYGKGLAWFTVVCLIVFILSVALNEVHAKGSGIEEVPQPTQYLFAESIVAEFLNAASERLNYNLRSRIRRWSDKTPEPLEPKLPAVLYDLADTAMRRRKITPPPVANATSNSTSNQALFQIPPGLLTRRGSQNIARNAGGQVEADFYQNTVFSLIRQAEKAAADVKTALELSALDIVGMYLNKPADSPEVNTFFQRCKAYHEGKGENPFTFKRTVIQGFNKPGNTENTRKCQHCDKPYIYGHHKQKYCSEACRIAAFEARKGKKLFKSDFKKQDA